MSGTILAFIHHWLLSDHLNISFYHLPLGLHLLLRLENLYGFATLTFFKMLYDIDYTVAFALLLFLFPTQGHLISLDLDLVVILGSVLKPIGYCHFALISSVEILSDFFPRL